MNTSHNPDPEPDRTTGLEPGGSVPPGETPPGEASTSSGTGPRVEPPRGWAKGPLIAIGVLVVLIAAFFLVYTVLI
ncbi:hypothetical protein AS594_30985 [Streptomyces agglomeratus]|uniref:Uncharacterized protein n=1 Tax=Streptomyces agglomeratus TaxID=285458 RepID=A0A1E5PFV4_9ACTN|nr:DUF6480 family protein [Streptomyces agglomeratus]OEJ28254.1 hypothetical protein AS594_30985 [Streptomyces agglomeratus]